MKTNRLLLFRIVLCIGLLCAVEAGRKKDFSLPGAKEDHRNCLIERDDLPGPYTKVLDSMLQQLKPCVLDEKYRRADASCNNLKNPFQGTPLQKQTRLFQNAYQDGKNFPREHGEGGSKLPSARLVSTRVFLTNEEHEEFFDSHLTQMTMQWGQYIDHDMTLTAEMMNKGLDCCSKGLDPSDIEKGGPCFPIEIPEGDSHFNTTCMPFKRSFALYDKKGVRQMLSGITSYIDASTVYGSSQAEQDELRSHKFGRLKVFKQEGGNTLPQQGSFRCRKELNVDITHCPHAGDPRVNVFPGLTLLHLLFVRHHNLLADHMHSLNPHWDDERIFQETRKIIIALHQKITYEEYLPHVLGASVMEHFRLGHVPYRYDKTENADLLIAFTTAAFRFGHAQINSFLPINGKETPISELYFQPWKATSSEEQIVEMMSSQCEHRVAKTNNFMTDQVTNLLFLNVDGPGKSTDLGARNIQRGRDHGLPAFKTFQRLALQSLGLGKNWPMRKSCKDLLNVYDSPEDVDLFPGGLCEKPTEGALVGPTFAYLIGEQFKRLKFGDRFWFETLKKDQLEQIRNMSLASIICMNTAVEKIQPDVFHRHDLGDVWNKPKSCHEYEKIIDLKAWKEK